MKHKQQFKSTELHALDEFLMDLEQEEVMQTGNENGHRFSLLELVNGNSGHEARQNGRSLKCLDQLYSSMEVEDIIRNNYEAFQAVSQSNTLKTNKNGNDMKQTKGSTEFFQKMLSDLEKEESIRNAIQNTQQLPSFDVSFKKNNGNLMVKSDKSIESEKRVCDRFIEKCFEIFDRDKSYSQQNGRVNGHRKPSTINGISSLEMIDGKYFVVYRSLTDPSKRMDHTQEEYDDSINLRSFEENEHKLFERNLNEQNFQPLNEIQNGPSTQDSVVYRSYVHGTSSVFMDSDTNINQNSQIENEKLSPTYGNENIFLSNANNNVKDEICPATSKSQAKEPFPVILNQHKTSLALPNHNSAFPDKNTIQDHTSYQLSGNYQEVLPSGSTIAMKHSNERNLQSSNQYCLEEIQTDGGDNYPCHNKAQSHLLMNRIQTELIENPSPSDENIKNNLKENIISKDTSVFNFNINNQSLSNGTSANILILPIFLSSDNNNSSLGNQEENPSQLKRMENQFNENPSLLPSASRYVPDKNKNITKPIKALSYELTTNIPAFNEPFPIYKQQITEIQDSATNSTSAIQSFQERNPDLRPLAEIPPEPFRDYPEIFKSSVTNHSNLMIRKIPSVSTKLTTSQAPCLIYPGNGGLVVPLTEHSYTRPGFRYILSKTKSKTAENSNHILKRFSLGRNNLKISNQKNPNVAQSSGMNYEKDIQPGKENENFSQIFLNGHVQNLSVTEDNISNAISNNQCKEISDPMKEAIALSTLSGKQLENCVFEFKAKKDICSILKCKPDEHDDEVLMKQMILLNDCKYLYKVYPKICGEKSRDKEYSEDWYSSFYKYYEKVLWKRIPNRNNSKDLYFHYKCLFCQKSLTTFYTLRPHLNKHLGILPYRCHHCTNRYFSKATLSKHFVKHESSICTPTSKDSNNPDTNNNPDKNLSDFSDMDSV